MLTPLILALLFNTLISPPPNPYIAPFSRTGPVFFGKRLQSCVLTSACA